MRYTVKAFGVTKEILGGREVIVEVNGETVADFRSSLQDKYPQLRGLRSLYIAVNNAYADETTRLLESDEIALIPPVSGG